MAKKRMIDTDEKSIRLILEGIKYAKEHDLLWAQRVYSGNDKGITYPCGSYCCILGHIGNKYNVPVKDYNALEEIVDTNQDQFNKLITCFSHGARLQFLRKVEANFGEKARKRIENASEGMRKEWK